MAYSQKIVVRSISCASLSRPSLNVYPKDVFQTCSRRHNSNIAAAPILTQTPSPTQGKNVPDHVSKKELPALSIMPTSSLIRSLFLGYMFTSNRLLKPMLSVMKYICESKSPLLNPDSNPILRSLIRLSVYDHFCAGTNPTEVKRTIAQIKGLGFHGVILGNAREILVPKDQQIATTQNGEAVSHDEFIASWLEGQVATLDLVGNGDYVNMKFTGAGPQVSKALLDNADPPKQLVEAMEVLCRQARVQGTRIWIDAEQQLYQPAIDRWTTDLMRRHNRDGYALVYNTFQAYLKSTPLNIAAHMKLAKDENWTLGIKLVRGAYIASDLRERIWDTKPETDHCYNTVSGDLLARKFPGFEGDKAPQVDMFLAGHNSHSIRKNAALVRDLVLTGHKIKPVAYGQLQGMADNVSCELIQQEHRAQKAEGLSESEAELERLAVPQAYKCLAWGSVSECMGFLMRRAVENASAADRLRDGLADIRAELRRRVFARA